jgi:ABC-type multidrug transport system fused ATPase/permease subunit
MSKAKSIPGWIARSATRAQYEIAQINLDNGVPGASTDVLEQQVNIAEASWETAKQNLKIAELNLESAKLNLEKAVIVAPFNGTVTDVTITKGEVIFDGVSFGYSKDKPVLKNLNCMKRLCLNTLGISARRVTLVFWINVMAL